MIEIDHGWNCWEEGGTKKQDCVIKCACDSVSLCDTDVLLVVMQDLALGKCHAHCMALEVPLFS